jgi:glycosyltransferase involved in cell wall biosynthesis
MQEGGVKRVRVLFLAWGYSIHGKRRIQIFVDDPRFDVMVVSTYDYRVENATNVLLRSAEGERGIRRGGGPAGQRCDARPLPSFLKKVRSGLVRMTEKGRTFCLMIQDLGQLRSTVREFRPDFVFLQTLLYPAYLSYFLSPSIPILITFWNGDLLWWAQWNGIEKLLKRQIVAYGVKRASLITVNSQKAFDTCLEYGARREKVEIIRYPGVDLSRFKPAARDVARERLGIRHPKVVFCPRGIGGFLNSETIVEAAPAVVESYPRTLFIFAGVMVEKELLAHQRRVRELGMEDHFLWKPGIRWEEMPLYYSCSDVMVSVSSNDSLPKCMLEAMACQIPVLMGDIPQIREWIPEEFNRFLVPPGDPVVLSERILWVFCDSDTRIEQFVQRNRNLVEREVDSHKNSEIIKNLVLRLAETREARA